MAYEPITRDSSGKTEDPRVTVSHGRFSFNTACSRGLQNLKAQHAQFFFDRQQMSVQIELHKVRQENSFKITTAKKGTRLSISAAIVLNKIGYDYKVKATAPVDINTKDKPPTVTFQLPPERFDPKKLGATAR